MTNGKNGRMPQWGDVLSREEIDEIWAYVETGGSAVKASMLPITGGRFHLFCPRGRRRRRRTTTSGTLSVCLNEDRSALFGPHTAVPARDLTS